MKSFLFFFLVVISVSCSKYKLNQPCSLKIQSDYISSSNPSEEFFSGSVNLTSMTFSGQREKGDPVEIKKEFSEKTMTIGIAVDFDTPIDIPVGTYTEYELKLKLAENNSIRLYKNVNNGINKPVIIEINEDINISFQSSATSPVLEKKQTYTAKLIWNFNLLFAGLSNQSINNSPTTLVNGVETVVINSNSNANILSEIKLNLPKAIELKIE